VTGSTSHCWQLVKKHLPLISKGLFWNKWRKNLGNVCLSEDGVNKELYALARLSYHQRVSEILPADFSKLVPTKPAPHFKYDRDGVCLRYFLSFTAVDVFLLVILV